MLVTIKTRVAPLKQTSIPRLELLGAFVLSSLVKRVKEAFSVKTDNMLDGFNGCIALDYSRERVKTVCEKP